MSMSKMQEVWLQNGLNKDNYTTAIADAMKDFAIQFANFVGDRPLPEYSKSTNKWRYWDNSTRDYKYATTEDFLAQFIVSGSLVV